jgi:hypothetical protein
MTENDYIAEYVKERHPGILTFDYALWRLARSISTFGVAMKDIISKLSAEDLEKMAQEVDDDEITSN